MRKDYSEFDAVKFSTDLDFLQWRISGNSESERFWKDFLNENPGKRAEIESAIRIVDSIRINDYRLSDEEHRSGWEKIQISTHKGPSKRKKIWIAYAAACVVLLLGVRYVVGTYTSFSRAGITSLTTADSDEQIRLVFGDNGSMAFDQNTDIMYDRAGNIVISNMSSDKVLTQRKLSDNQTANKLIVPKGKRSSLILPDGSKVWVNSGTTIQFPRSFAPDRREIVVDGEIYIEVTKDADRPFIVKTSKFDIQVLGTKFNVSAYKEDPVNCVTLVEGSVKVEDRSGRKAVMKPDDQLNVSAGGFSKKSVDVYDYISWKDGIFNFSKEPLGDILVKLSRYYNFSVDCSDDIRNIPISGKLVLFDNPEMALNSISIIVPVQYTKENEKFVFRKKNN